MAVSRESEATGAWLWLTYAAGACAIVLLYTLPILSCGLIGSDIFRSALPAYAAAGGLTLWQTLSVVARDAATHVDRLPIRLLELAFWFAHPAPQVGHALQIVVLAANVVTASIIAATVLRNVAYFGITAAFAVACLQLRPGDDPTLGQTLTSTVGCEFVLLALLMCLRFFDTRRRVWLSLGALFGLLAACADASSVALVIALPAILVFRPQSRFAGAIALAAGVGLMIAALSFLQGVTLAAPLGEALSRIAAALPTSYRFTHALISARPSFGGGPPDLRFSSLPGIGPPGILAALASFLLVYIGAQTGGERTIAADRLALLACGLALWLVPSWLPGGAYIQWLGVAMSASAALSAALALGARGNCRPVFSAAVALTAGIIVLGNVATELFVIERNQPIYQTRQLFEQSADAGVFSYVRDGSIVALDPRTYPFVFSDDWRDARYTLYAITGKMFATVPAARALATHEHTVWTIATSFAPDHSERDLNVGRWAGGGPDPLVDQLISFRSYASGAARDAAQAAILSGGRGLVTSASAVGDGDLLAFVTRSCGASTIANAFDAKPSIRWGAGFLPDAGYPPAEIIGALATPFAKHSTHLWRFASPSSVLEVVRDRCRQTPLFLTMTVSAAAPGAIAVSTAGYSSTYAVSQLTGTIRFGIPPGRPGSVARVSIVSETPAARYYYYSVPRARYLEKTGDISLFVTDPEADYN